MGRALFEHNLTFVGAIDVFRTQHRLPASSYTPFGNNQIIPAIALQELRALSHRSLIDRHALIEQLLAVGRHLMYDNRPCTMFAATQISLSVVIPKRTRVFPFRHALYQMQGCPGTMWILRRTHIESLVWGAEIHIVETVVITDGRRPRPTGIMPVTIPARLIEATVDLTDIAPIDHILRL